MQWWRGTGYSPSTYPWCRFCASLADRFAEQSICDNVRPFHALTQTSTVSCNIEQFERLLNLVRRNNSNLPNDYFVNCFISDLNDYIQHHLQSHKPKDMQEAMWFARRIEMSPPVRKPVYQPTIPLVRWQVYFELQKPMEMDKDCQISSSKLGRKTFVINVRRHGFLATNKCEIWHKGTNSSTTTRSWGPIPTSSM
jgi:hypothetical protein